MSGDGSSDKLVRMANDIANFFKAYGEVAAVSGIRHHIESFWTPSMRTALQRKIAAGEAVALHPFATKAFDPSATEGGPARRDIAGPAEAGQIGASDAG